MRSLEQQICQLLTNSFLRPPEAFNKMSAIVKGDQVSQGLLCISCLILVIPEYSVTWEETNYFPQPHGYFWVTHPRMPLAFFCCEGTMLTHSQLVYQDTQILFCNALFHPANLQPLLVYGVIPCQVQHNDGLEVHGALISPWLQPVKDPLSKIFAPLPKHINPFLQFDIIPQLFEVHSGSSSRPVTKMLNRISPSIDTWGKLLVTIYLLFCWSQTFDPNGPASFPPTLQPTYPFHMSSVEP